MGTFLANQIHVLVVGGDTNHGGGNWFNKKHQWKRGFIQVIGGDINHGGKETD